MPPLNTVANNPRVLVLGASGFLGGVIAARFAAHGLDVTGVGRSSQHPSGITRYVRMPLPNPEVTDLIRTFEPTACVIATGSAVPSASVANPAEDFASGPPVVMEILDAIRMYAPACRVAFLSSAAVYGNQEAIPISESAALKPVSPYGFHKVQCELLLQEFAQLYGLRTASLRIFSAYGPGFRRQVVWDTLRKLFRGEPLVLFGTGAESRDFIEVTDVALALETVLDAAPMEGEAYNVATGRETTIRALAELLIQHSGREAELRFTGSTQLGTPIRWRAEISRLRRLGFEPRIPLEQGLKATTERAKEILLNE